MGLLLESELRDRMRQLDKELAEKYETIEKKERALFAKTNEVANVMKDCELSMAELVARKEEIVNFLGKERSDEMINNMMELHSQLVKLYPSSPQMKF